MMPIWGQRCAPGPICVNATPLIGCENLGYKCVNYSMARLINKDAATDSPDITVGLLIYNEHGEFAGWQIKRPGATGLQSFDVVTTINGVVPDEGFFEALAKHEGKPMSFALAIYRDGRPLTVLCNRV